MLFFSQKKAKPKTNNPESQNLVSSRRAYFREVRRVVEAADVIIEVLDARDPIGTRCLELEKEILTSGGQKKLVLLLNKIGNYISFEYNLQFWKHDIIYIVNM